MLGLSGAMCSLLHASTHITECLLVLTVVTRLYCRTPGDRRQILQDLSSLDVDLPSYLGPIIEVGIMTHDVKRPRWQTAAQFIVLFY